MGFLKIKYIGASPIVQKLSVPVSLSASLGLKFIIPGKDNETSEIAYDVGAGKGDAENLKVDLFEQFREKGYIIGNLDTDAGTILKIQDTDLSRGGRVHIDEAGVADEDQGTSGITTEIEDASGNDYNHVNFNDIEQVYDAGTVMAIPYDRIFRIERLTVATVDQIRLYYRNYNIAGFNYIKFTAGTIDVTKINRRKQVSGAGVISDVTVLVSDFTSANVLDILENILYTTVLKTEGDGVHILNYDTENITAEVIPS
tara:strand:+ start:275 stop:1045 length:771 start_codon:yes stop_codon:yes gene_type:complete